MQKEEYPSGYSSFLLKNGRRFCVGKQKHSTQGKIISISENRSIPHRENHFHIGKQKHSTQGNKKHFCVEKQNAFPH